MKRWLRKPHVLEFWPEQMTDKQITEKYLSHIDSNIVFPFLIYFSETAIGYIQAYQANHVGDGWWPDEKEGTYGLDLFIGEVDYLGKGYGTKVIKSFLNHIRNTHEVRKWIIDVDPKNTRAIRCYEKAGFRFVKEIDTPDGKANLMEKSD